MDEQELRERIAAEGSAIHWTRRRREVVVRCGASLAATGRHEWFVGYIAGDDRKSGASPFGFGDDARVAVAVAAQIGGELLNGALALLDAGNMYSAAALSRQILEVEYLVATFAEREGAASTWLRSTNEERRRQWSAAHLRQRSEAKFIAQDYWRHCDFGGHPTPHAVHFLPDHQQVAPGIQWADLASHGGNLCRRVKAALPVDGLGLDDGGLDKAIAAFHGWYDADPLMTLADENHATIYGTAEPAS